MMTIGQFSERTGLRPKTLRYYEEVELLVPAVRLDNGYRHYSEEQVEKAQLISSLRQAGVRVADIRDFLGSDQAKKEELLAKWREEAAAKLLSIQVANQFLGGLDSHTKHVHLMYWERPQAMLWFTSDDTICAGDWKKYAQGCQRQLLDAGFEHERSCYVRLHENADGLQVQFGFLLTGNAAPHEGKVEEYAPTLFATLECDTKMPLPCKPIFSAVRRFGFRPVGEPLRKYSDFSAFTEGRYLLMVPVIHY